jgi:hypothetical protein
MPNGHMFMDVQCNYGQSQDNPPVSSVGLNSGLSWFASPDTRYELVYVHDTATRRTKFFVDGVEITPPGGSTTAKLFPYNGYVSIGYNDHGDSNPLVFDGGTVHEISFHDCISCVVPSAPSDGGDGTCAPGADLPRGEQCVPTCVDQDAIPAPTMCDNLGMLIPGSCACACEEKMARFGFIFGDQTRVYP